MWCIHFFTFKGRSIHCRGITARANWPEMFYNDLKRGTCFWLPNTGIMQLTFNDIACKMATRGLIESTSGITVVIFFSIKCVIITKWCCTKALSVEYLPLYILHRLLASLFFPQPCNIQIVKGMIQRTAGLPGRDAR